MFSHADTKPFDQGPKRARLIPTMFQVQKFVDLKGYLLTLFSNFFIFNIFNLHLVNV
jgi:hypothetical protein